MTKKFFAVLLVCMLVLMSFSACGTKAPENDTTAPENTSEAEIEDVQTSAEESESSSETALESTEPKSEQDTQKPAESKPAAAVVLHQPSPRRNRRQRRSPPNPARQPKASLK